jgi:feruloyl esterase
MTTFNDWDVTPLTCTQLDAGALVNTPSGQSSVGCGASFTPSVDVCQVTLSVKTSGSASTYMEVWLPNGNKTAWNGRSMSTDNGGLNGCVHYVDMQYVSGLGFASIGDNAGHNGSSFDGTWTMNNNEAVVDWAFRSRHASVDVGKQVINQFYEKKPDYSYYIGCSAGGAQGLQSAQKFPNDFDGIIAGASANDFNHLQDWSAHFRQITGAAGNDSFLTVDDWTTVQGLILTKCDAAIDGVADGILEDPTLCDFDAETIPVCSTTVTTGCLTATQIETVKDVFLPLYNSANKLIYPALLKGAQVDAFRLGLLSGSVQGIAQDFFRGAVFNSSSFDITTISKADYDLADSLDDLHGNPSAFNGDLSAFAGANKKLIMYHGMADPMTSGTNSQRYYQKVASTMGGLSNEAMDDFLRFFRISGMAHCGVGGISGAGAWMFGQSGAASAASNNIVANLMDWVEQGNAPDVMTGTKFWYDTPADGIEFERSHCRYPYRTTFKGGDAASALTPDGWDCVYIDDWKNCEGVTCDADGTFT